ncbi:unnamed protein product [Hermetia illucens]|uniref:Uncharacterized protein n=1 Tax=Hermetia illucens TaxID=343691 RepID=A0A7R8YTW8_HERIL|nr:unnamed protein product [Hermetia illucens]
MDLSIGQDRSLQTVKRPNKVRTWHRFPRIANNGRLSKKSIAIAKATFWENAQEFSRNTTLHALKYVGDRNLSPFERIFFFLAFAVALSIALYFISNMYEKWSSTPVIITNSATSTYISEIPFPAVTICNMNQALKSKVSGLTEGTAAYSILQSLCNRADKTNTTTISSKWNDFQDFILQSTQSCKDMFVLCKFATLNFNCTQFFKSALTDEGHCCTFNTVDPGFMYNNHSYSDYNHNEGFMPKDFTAIDWTPESGYPKDLPKNIYPRTASGTGYTMGLTLVMNADIDNYYCSSSNGAGFKVLLHSPVEAPNIGDLGFSIQAGYETRAVITPNLNDASVTIRDMTKDVRQCLFEFEANLSYFRTYSRRNCEMECEARLVAESCNCILYFMPRIFPDISICGIKDKDCYEAINIKVQTANLDTNNCSKECMAGCFDLTYDASTYAAPILGGLFDVRQRIIQRMSREFAEKNIAVAHFYYIENSFRSRTREQFVGFTEFLSSTGGLMGLFIGFSVISVVEIIYYASFRPFCASKRYKAQFRQSRSGSVQKRKLPFQNILRGFSHNKVTIFAEDEIYPPVRKFRKMQGFGKGEEAYFNGGYLP